MPKVNTKFAVIRIKGMQFKVKEGDEILVDKLTEKEPKADVLLFSDEKGVKLGKPTVDGAKVNFKVIEEQEKGEKIYVQKYKAKSRYRKKIGFRPIYTKLQVVKIS